MYGSLHNEMVQFMHLDVVIDFKRVVQFTLQAFIDGKLHSTSSHLISSHLCLNREDRWDTTDDFATSFLHFSLFPTALWDLAKLLQSGSGQCFEEKRNSTSQDDENCRQQRFDLCGRNYGGLDGQGISVHFMSSNLGFDFIFLITD